MPGFSGATGGGGAELQANPNAAAHALGGAFDVRDLRCWLSLALHGLPHADRIGRGLRMLALRRDDNLLTCLLSKACPISTVATRWQWGAAQLADCTRTVRMSTDPSACSSSLIAAFAFVSRKRFENRFGPSLGSSRMRFGATGRRGLSFAIARLVSFASVASSAYKPVAMHLSARTDPHICATRRRNGQRARQLRGSGWFLLCGGAACRLRSILASTNCSYALLGFDASCPIKEVGFVFMN